MIEATLYQSGFTLVDVPASPSVLEQNSVTTVTMPTLDIIDIYSVTSLKLKCEGTGSDTQTKTNILMSDYAKLEDNETGEVAYYNLTGNYTMSSKDVIVVEAVLDPVLTLGGIDALVPISGSVVRTTTWGNLLEWAYAVKDPTLTRNYSFAEWYITMFPPEQDSPEGVEYFLADADVHPNKKWLGSSGGHELYGSNYAAIDQAVLAELQEPVKIQVTDTEQQFSPNFNKMTRSIGIESTAETIISVGSPHPTYNLLPHYIYPGLTFFSKSFLSTAKTLYQYGIERPIVESYILPSGYANISGSMGNIDAGGYAKEIRGNQGWATVSMPMTDIVRGMSDIDTTVQKAIMNSTVRVMLTAYATGQSSEVAFSDLFGVVDESYKIYVDLFVDPGPHGAPYFRLRPWEVHTGTAFPELNGAVRGATWMRAPITYSGLGYLTDLTVNNVRAEYAAGANTIANDSAARQLEWAMANKNTQTVLSGIEKGLELTGYGISGGETTGYNASTNYNRSVGVSESNTSTYPKGLSRSFADRSQNSVVGSYTEGNRNISYKRNFAAIPSYLSGQVSQQSAIEQEKLNVSYAQMQRNLDLAREQSMFNAQHLVTEQNTQFAIQDGMQPLIGNGCLLHIKYPREDDVKNMVRIIQHYGISYNVPLNGWAPLVSEENTDVAPSFDDYWFIKTTGIVFENRNYATAAQPLMPRRLLRQAAEMFDNGVRFWKIRPNKKTIEAKFRIKEET